MASVTCMYCMIALDLPLPSSCPQCGTSVPRASRHLQPERSVDNDPAKDAIETTAAEHDRAEAPSREGRCDHQEMSPGAISCPSCGDAPTLGRTDRRALLIFPWGEQCLAPGETLEIGREVGPLQRHLDAYRTVGRRHATLRFTGSGVLLVRDHSSMNGTYIDSRRCDPAADSEVPDGAELRFSGRLRVVVRFEQ